ncbi:hypothetical protein [Burkholderia vietnamiensis]|uniref:hypothetical protein n=1 Tax=Burkholderia vietnamiensis TaxID=60552 RepID=UPI001CF3463E|nr:hypothetical protein [Burkholderia vietnamiensis]MCA8287582.1 hypothetical protein [Burkholderia vietnamiensis]
MLHSLQAIFHAELRVVYLAAIVMFWVHLMEIFGVLRSKSPVKIWRVVTNLILIGVFAVLLSAPPFPGIGWNLFLVVITSYLTVVDLAFLFSLAVLMIVTLLAAISGAAVLTLTGGAKSVKRRDVNRDLTPEEKIERQARLREMGERAKEYWQAERKAEIAAYMAAHPGVTEEEAAAAGNGSDPLDDRTQQVCRKGQHPYPDENVYAVSFMRRLHPWSILPTFSFVSIVARKPESAIELMDARVSTGVKHSPFKATSLAALKAIRRPNRAQRIMIDRLTLTRDGKDKDEWYALDYDGGEDEELIRAYQATLSPEQKAEMQRRSEREIELEDKGLL